MALNGCFVWDRYTSASGEWTEDLVVTSGGPSAILSEKTGCNGIKLCLISLQVLKCFSITTCNIINLNVSRH